MAIAKSCVKLPTGKGMDLHIDILLVSRWQDVPSPTNKTNRLGRFLPLLGMESEKTYSSKSPAFGDTYMSNIYIYI